MYLVHNNRAPSYLVDSVTATASLSHRGRLRSASSQHYEQPSTRLKFGERCFAFAGPSAWNSLPSSVQLKGQDPVHPNFGSGGPAPCPKPRTAQSFWVLLSKSTKLDRNIQPRGWACFQWLRYARELMRQSPSAHTQTNTDSPSVSGS